MAQPANSNHSCCGGGCNGGARLLRAVSPGASPLEGPERLIGLLEGEGVGPEVIGCALEVLKSVESVSGKKFKIVRGGAVGLDAEAECGKYLSDEVVGFFRDIFAAGGTVINGPGGGRYVYDLRKQFDLYCKLAPIHTLSAITPEGTPSADIMIVRDNIAGVYQGEWRESFTPGEGRTATHCFQYTERQVRRLLEAGARVAKARRGLMSVIVKDGGVPTITKLWRDVANEAAAAHGVELCVLNVDYAAYLLLRKADQFDVIVAPNMLGDILADLGGLVLGSRGLCYSANYTPDGHAVYQTGHGSAHDLAGTDRANPIGQILSLSMMLRETFGMAEEADMVESAIDRVLRAGWHTEDLPGTTSAIGTKRMGELIAEAVSVQVPRRAAATRATV